jgi:hypothetical protein
MPHVPKWRYWGSKASADDRHKQVRLEDWAPCLLFCLHRVNRIPMTLEGLRAPRGKREDGSGEGAHARRFGGLHGRPE